MLMNGREIKIFKLQDLNSRISFSNWIKINISNERKYSADQIFESKRYLEYLKYIEGQLKSQPLKNKIDWIERIKVLRKEREQEK